MSTSSGGLAAHLSGWDPPAERREEVMSPEPAVALAALLDEPAAGFSIGANVPPLWHWLYFLDRVPQADLGADGHPRDGSFLPPIPHRRRMFAGGRLDVTRPLRFGETVTRTSRIGAVVAKTGRQGEMLFVTVRHELQVGDDVCVVEEADLVYRSEDPDDAVPNNSPAHDSAPSDSPAHDSARSAVASPEPSSAPWQLSFCADPPALFRFSALTYNAHRIHYDLPYTQQVEHFPGLVVHGPLLALLLLELPRRNRPDRSVTGFDFRARRPIFAGQPVLFVGEPQVSTGDDAESAAQLSARTTGPDAAMTGQVRFSAGR
jgi:hydroxyacyl-ACP dehydratase HTD2-like protein with hotdog domain